MKNTDIEPIDNSVLASDVFYRISVTAATLNGYVSSFVTDMDAMAIKHWPISERPQERLLEKGASALSDAELLAVFLRTGYKGHSAVDLARQLLLQFGNLHSLLHANATDVCSISGLGPSKYAQIQVIKEISLRAAKTPLAEPKSMTSSKQVGEYLCQRMGAYQREVFAVLLLDSQNRLINMQELFFGTIDSATVHPREVVKVALQNNAASMILAHNHPSGVAEPSNSDRLLTETLQATLHIIGVRILDHVVVGSCQWVSFADRGWM